MVNSQQLKRMKRRIGWMEVIRKREVKRSGNQESGRFSLRVDVPKG